MSQNSSFVLLVIVIGLVHGELFTLRMMISNLTDPFGVSGSDASLTMLPLLFFSVIGAICIGLYVDATNKYKFALQTVTAMIALSWSMVVFS